MGHTIIVKQLLLSQCTKGKQKASISLRNLMYLPGGIINTLAISSNFSRLHIIGEILAGNIVIMGFLYIIDFSLKNSFLLQDLKHFIYQLSP